MNTTTTPRPRFVPTIRRARVATVFLFFFSGLALAVWVVSIPVIQLRTGLDHGALGSVLLLLGLGSFIGMTAAGPLVDRIGSRPTAAIGALILIVGVNLPGLATNGWELGGALFLLGLGSGSTDVAMNDQAVIVERAYRRPIMSSFHAFFSVGGGVGALLGAGLQGLGVSVNWLLGIGAVICALMMSIAYPALLAGGHTENDTSEPEETLTGRRRTIMIVVLAGLAFVMMLAEGTANDWSSLQAVERFGADASAAAIAFGFFAVAMTIGRFAADYVSRRVGPVAIVRGGSIIAAAGMLTVVLSPTYQLTLAGWLAFGLGLSGVVPQIFTAAGRLSGRNQGAVISRVVGAGYLGLLAGPAVIGWVSQGIGLTLALCLPVICSLLGIFLAGRVGGRAIPRTDDAHSLQRV